MTGALQDLALIAVALACAAGLLSAAIATLVNRPAAARRGALLAAIVVAAYGAALLGASLASRERTLPIGAEKSVSGFDPHLHWSVLGAVQRVPGGDQLVTVRLRSDARRALQDPGTLRARLADDRGRCWPPLGASPGAAPESFRGPLAPGEERDAVLAFRPAPDAAGLRLLVSEAGFPCPIEIGHEASPLHRKTWFALGPSGHR